LLVDLATVLDLCRHRGEPPPLSTPSDPVHEEEPGGKNADDKNGTQ